MSRAHRAASERLEGIERLRIADAVSTSEKALEFTMVPSRSFVDKIKNDNLSAIANCTQYDAETHCSLSGLRSGRVLQHKTACTSENKKSATQYALHPVRKF